MWPSRHVRSTLFHLKVHSTNTQTGNNEKTMRFEADSTYRSNIYTGCLKKIYSHVNFSQLTCEYIFLRHPVYIYIYF